MTPKNRKKTLNFMTDQQNPFLTPAFDTDTDPFPNAGENLTGDKRTEARLCAVQATAQHLATDEALQTITKEFATHQIPPRKADKKIFTAVMASTEADMTKYIQILTPTFPQGRSWKDANPVHQALLLTAMAEWHSDLTTPPKTVLNEILNISKGFCTPEEVAFINGLLNTVMQKLMLV